MHYCCNVVTGKEGAGAAVLIRAVEPIDGVAVLEERRMRSGVEVTNGPAKLCKALGIDKALNGHDLSLSPLKLFVEPEIPGELIVSSERIGITQAKDVKWRFYIRDNAYASR